MTPEGFIRNQICAYLRSIGAFVFVHDSVGIYDPVRKRFRANKNPWRLRGVSDILGIYDGRFLAVEVKCKGRYASKEQKWFLSEVNKNGGVGLVARSVEDVKTHLASIIGASIPEVEG